MKKMICAVLALLLILTGCQAAGGETTLPETQVPDAETTQAPEETEPMETVAATLPETGLITGPVMGGMEGEELPFENAGKIRLNYEGNRSYVRYVTKVEDLPGEGSWTGYDEAFFETKALLIVVETLNSGSVQVDMESILVNGNTAGISIKRTMSGDVGTADMATWMLWAEVEKGLEYEWTLVNASQLPEGEKY